MFQSLTRRVLEPQAFGLDISDLTVKFVRIRRRGDRAAIEYFGEVEIPAGLVVGGEIQKEEELARVLRSSLRLAGGRRVLERYVVASLPEEKSFVHLLDLPPMKAEDVGKAVRWEVEGVVPLAPSEIVYDYELTPRLPSATDHRDVLLTAFPKQIVESYRRVLEGAGLITRALELESQAISRALISGPGSQAPVIIADLGATRTSFIVFAGGSMLFTKSVPVGGHDFEATIAHALGVPPAEAVRVKIEVGLKKTARQGKVFVALEPHLSSLAAELGAIVQFYREHPMKQHAAPGDIERVVLCGGDANLIGIEKYLAVAVKKRAVLGDPFVNLAAFPGALPAIPKNEALKYTTAIGLALRAAGL